MLVGTGIRGVDKTDSHIRRYARTNAFKNIMLAKHLLPSSCNLQA